MKISYNVEKNDLWKFQWYAFFTNKFLRKFALFIIAIQLLVSFVPFYYALILLLKGQIRDDVPVGLYFAWAFAYCLFQAFLNLAATAAVVAVVLVVYQLVLLNSNTPDAGVLGQHTLELEEDYLRETTDVNDTKHSWKQIQKIVERKTYFLLFTSSNSAHIIPKRSFQTEPDAVVFFEEANRLKELSNTQFSPSYLASNS